MIYRIDSVDKAPTASAPELAQLKGVAVTVLWSGIGSLILYKVVDVIVGLRTTVEAEREGLDLATHGEAAYHS